ncbi:D(1B) dopamine receptor [Biomphalaria pfeifferi]|uniref:D(1B) dopamine receptor n=1 Tax=Biomphalaria pfeifferi TaxID=112525 RepID=A0AAD8BJ06_BIOPF|nr:D(1B) dopamine receptor [Biomphalaria pfeifferi]
MGYSRLGLKYPYHNIIALSFIFTFFVNVVTTSLVLKSKDLRKLHHAFIIGQVGNDILFSFILLIVHFSESTLTLDVLLNFIGILELSVNYTSIVLISINRYVFFTNPFLHMRLLTKRNVVIVFGVMWIVSLSVSCPVCECNSFEFSFSRYSRIIHLYCFPVTHCLCLLVIIVIHTHICIIANRHVNTIARQNVMLTDKESHRRTQTDIRRTEIKSVIFFLVVCCSYLVLITPLLCCKLYLLNANSASVDIQLFKFISLLCYAASHLTNIINVIKIPSFTRIAKEELLKAFRLMLDCMICIFIKKNDDYNTVLPRDPGIAMREIVQH